MLRNGKLKFGIASSKSRNNGHGRCCLCSLSGSHKSSKKIKGKRKHDSKSILLHNIFDYF